MNIFPLAALFLFPLVLVIGLVLIGKESEFDKNEKRYADTNYTTPKVLSTKGTWMYKILFPFIFVIALGLLSYVAVDFYITEDSYYFAILLVVFIIFVPRFLLVLSKFKNVSIDQDYLYISNYFRTEKVELIDISNARYVVDNYFPRYHIPKIWVTFKKPIAFGSEIVFSPAWRFSAYMLDPHPYADEIITMRDIYSKTIGKKAV